MELVSSFIYTFLPTSVVNNFTYIWPKCTTDQFKRCILFLLFIFLVKEVSHVTRINEFYLYGSLINERDILLDKINLGEMCIKREVK